MQAPNLLSGSKSRANDWLLQRLVYEAARHVIWRALARYRLSDADWEDLVHDVMEKAWTSREQYRADRGSPEQWLSVITRSVVIDFRRARRSGRGLVLGSAFVDA